MAHVKTGKGSKIDTPEQRMLTLMQWAVGARIAETEYQYWAAIGFNPKAISNIRTGRQGFTRAQITAACKLTGASADWVLGITKTMFREGTAKTPAQVLRQVAAQLDSRGT